ncbi:phage integrase family protein [Gloeomargarita lithophora Alchichica-D10]|uniref:Phage integrase family protein n=1 Tax=Gloeomargarita lithophora Alchichica-D10 TaxID=1188229 RepID=A0A1J0AG48_9CYAN|nr:site-specific integrase [Gloeomargarita lithophora]APB34910.1 phage integrase family protein [Gloeomargarita lithophora Alchichica-D10]
MTFEVLKDGGKGKVAIVRRDEFLSVRWSYKGKRYGYISLGHNSLKRAEAVVLRIEDDMAAGLFDASLHRYFPKDDGKSGTRPVPDLGLLELWQSFTEWSRIQGATERYLNWRYPPMAANLTRWGRQISDSDSAREFMEFLRSRQSPTTANRNLSFLRGFGRWCVEQNQWQVNHFEKLKPAKVQTAPKRDNPFTAEEVTRFLATIKVDPHYFRYHDFAYCLFHLGCRPSELIGLRWGAIDFTRRLITISESLSRGDDGKTAGYARKRKATKTGNVRTLPMTESVYALLMGRFQEAQPKSFDELIFTSPTGRAIDDHNFSQRCWRSICQKAGIPYRPPYIARHTALSHIVENIGSLAQAAAVAGHSSLRMVSQTYGHLVAKIEMPDYGEKTQ